MPKKETSGSQESRGKNRNRALLEKYLNDPEKLPVYPETQGEHGYYDFIDYVKDFPDEYRVHYLRFIARDDGEVEVIRSVSKWQKFVCVGGPQDGQKLTERAAADYLVYTCASFNRGSRHKSILKAILVHRSLLAS